MHGTALGHSLETLHDGLTTFCDGEPTPMPLVGTEIRVRVMAGLAVVRTIRTFRNIEHAPIEAVMTFPVGFDAVVTELAATIDGRRLIGVAKGKAQARDDYETALDEGRLSVLHEEVLRGIHVLSVGALPPGAQVAVELEQVVPLANIGGTPFLRLPTTTGQLYGTSPLLPSDDLVTAHGVRHEAVLNVTTDHGRAVLHGQPLSNDAHVQILLDRAIELRIEGGSFGGLQGRSADGRRVEVVFEPAQTGEAPLDLHVIVDHSGSTGCSVREGGLSVWEAMRDGLTRELAALRPADQIALWQFDDTCEHLGTASGPAASHLAARLEGPAGGTELAGAIKAALRKKAKDILVLTDGETWAHLVDELKQKGLRISAILAGPGSLDANIGHLCAMTGGQVLYAPGRDVASALRTAFAALRSPAGAIEGQIMANVPDRLQARRGGVTIRATWRQAGAVPADPMAHAVGRFSAALALPLLDADAGEAWASAHSLCTHSTSLVLVDDVGEAVEGFSRMRKVPLMSAESASFAMFSRMEDAALPTHSFAESASMSVVNSRVVGDLAMLASKSRSRRSTKFGGPVGAVDRPVVTASTTLGHGGFAGFAWDRWGDELLAGDFSSLTAEQRRTMERLGADLLQDARWDLLIDPVSAAVDPAMQIACIWALGLIARRMKERLAEHFARRALSDASDWVLDLA